MKAQRTDLPEDNANVLFQPDFSATASNQASTAIGGNDSMSKIINYDTNVDTEQMSAQRM